MATLGADSSNRGQAGEIQQGENQITQRACRSNAALAQGIAQALGGGSSGHFFITTCFCLLGFGICGAIIEHAERGYHQLLGTRTRHKAHTHVPIVAQRLDDGADGVAHLP